MRIPDLIESTKQLVALDTFMVQFGFERVEEGTTYINTGEILPEFSALSMETAVRMYNTDFEKIRHAKGHAFLYRFPKTGTLFVVSGVRYAMAQYAKEQSCVPVVSLYAKKKEIFINKLKSYVAVDYDQFAASDNWNIVDNKLTFGEEKIEMTDDEFLKSNLVEGGWVVVDDLAFFLGKRDKSL